MSEEIFDEIEERRKCVCARCRRIYSEFIQFSLKPAKFSRLFSTGF